MLKQFSGKMYYLSLFVISLKNVDTLIRSPTVITHLLFTGRLFKHILFLINSIFCADKKSATFLLALGSGVGPQALRGKRQVMIAIH